MPTAQTACRSAGHHLPQTPGTEASRGTRSFIERWPWSVTSATRLTLHSRRWPCSTVWNVQPPTVYRWRDSMPRETDPLALSRWAPRMKMVNSVAIDFVGGPRRDILRHFFPHGFMHIVWMPHFAILSPDFYRTVWDFMCARFCGKVSQEGKKSIFEK